MRRVTSMMAIGVLTLILGVASTVTASAAKGGNNDTAKLCQHGAWQALLSESGKAFKNQGDCVNDGAQAVPTWGAEGQAACQAIPGYQEGFFSVGGDSSWTCQYVPGANPPNDQHTETLKVACFADAGEDGGLSTELANGGYWLATCQD